jgi:uncharacterized protein (TIGR03437 family)
MSKGASGTGSGARRGGKHGGGDACCHQTDHAAACQPAAERSALDGADIRPAAGVWRQRDFRKPILEWRAHGWPAVVIISELAHLLVVATALSGFVATAAADEIVTVAGSGTDGYSGDGGAALAAEIGGISGLAVDTQGNVYFADSWNQRVRMLAPTGVVSTIAGNGTSGDAGDGGPAVSASLLWPAGVAVDTEGNLYVSSGSRVRKVSPNGKIAAFAGGTTAGYGGDGGAATSARLTEPHGLAVDSAGNVYVADSGNSRIRRVDRTGVITTIAGNGVSGDSGDGGPATSAQIGYVHALAFDSTGNLYFSDPYNHCVRRVLTSGTVETVAGGAFGSQGDGEPAGQAQLMYPYGLVVDGAGNIYIADLLNYRVRVVGTDGTTFTAAGTGSPGFSGDGEPGPYAALDMPAELALAPGGDIYVADLRNFRIRELLSPQTPPQPAVNSAPGAVNAASYSGVAPGALVAIFGRNLAYGIENVTAFPLPASLGGATVSINGAPAPLLYVSSSQINFQMPYVSPGSVALSVQRDGIDSGTLSVAVAATDPGIFALPENQGAILNEDYTVNDPGLPAHLGRPAIIWGTGAGAVAPPVSAGQAAPVSPLSTTPQYPTVTIGGVPAQVLFTGLAPGFVGLWQINVVVPQNAPVGDDIPVQISLDGAPSNTVTMAIAP